MAPFKEKLAKDNMANYNMIGQKILFMHITNMVENSYIFKSYDCLKMISKKCLMIVLTYNRIIKYLIAGLMYGNIH